LFYEYGKYTYAGFGKGTGNFRYLVTAFYRLGYPLRERLGVLEALNMGHCLKRYSDDHWI
jgi:hypothetical protein